MSRNITPSSFKVFLALSGLTGILASPVIFQNFKLPSLWQKSTVANAASGYSVPAISKNVGRRGPGIVKNFDNKEVIVPILVTPKMRREFKSPPLSKAEKIRLQKLLQQPRLWSDRTVKLRKLASQQVEKALLANRKNSSQTDIKPVKSLQKTSRGLRILNAEVYEGPFANSNGLPAPPDPSIAAGETSIGLVTNTVFKTYSKVSPTFLKESINLDPFFLEAYGAMVDPRIVYDKTQAKWIITALKRNPITIPYSTVNEIKVAISKTSDPTGPFYIYKFDINTDSTPTKGDYPMVGFNKDYVFVTTDRIVDSPRKRFGTILTLPKSNLYLGRPTTFRVAGSSLRPLMQTIAPPIVKDNGTSANFLATDSTYPGVNKSSNSLLLYQLNPSTGVYGTYRIPVGTYYEMPEGVPQYASSTRLDAFGALFQGPSIQIGSNLWNVHSSLYISRFTTSLRYYRIDTTNRAVKDNKEVYSSSNFYFHPAIDVNSENRPFITYNSTGPGIRPEINLITCSAFSVISCDFADVRNLNRSTVSYESVNGLNPTDYGDYSSIVVDPGNLTQIWTFGQYNRSSKIWGTKYGKITYSR